MPAAYPARVCTCVYVHFCDWHTAVQQKMRTLLCVCNRRSQPLLINLLEDKPVLSPCLNSLCEVSPTDMWLANHTNRPSLPFHIQYSSSLTPTRLLELNFNFNEISINITPEPPLITEQALQVARWRGPTNKVKRCKVCVMASKGTHWAFVNTVLATPILCLMACSLPFFPAHGILTVPC